MCTLVTGSNQAVAAPPGAMILGDVVLGVDDAEHPVFAVRTGTPHAVAYRLLPTAMPRSGATTSSSRV